VLAIVLVAVLVGVGLLPVVQTWVAQMELDRQPGVHASLGSISAGFGKVEVTDLQLEAGGAVLTLPSLQARLPVTVAAWGRAIRARSVMAKGWTIDLSRIREPGNPPTGSGQAAAGGGGSAPTAPADAVRAQKAMRAFDGILRGLKLPFDLSLDEVELEGDVLVAVTPGKVPDRVHVTVKGGGLSSGHEGTFAIDATCSTVDSDLEVIEAAAHGRVVVAMESPRTVSRIGINAAVSAKGGSLPADFAWSADVAVARGAGEETYTIDLGRGSRHLAVVSARFPDATRRFAGTWKVDLRDSDLALLAPSQPLPSLAATGEGDFDADDAFARVHAAGRLSTVASHLGVLAPPLDRLGDVTLEARFDLARSGHSIRVKSLDVLLAGTHPAAVVHALQSFDFDEQTRELAVADPQNDWLEASIQGMPLAWLSDPGKGFNVAGGDATGEFFVRAANGKIALRPKTPLAAAGVSVKYGGRILGQGLDLSASLSADYDSQGWQLRVAPLTARSAGRAIVTGEGTLSRTAGADHPTVIAGQWNADLDAMAAQPAIRGIAWMAGRSASGDFSVVAGSPAKVEGRLNVVGHDPSHSITATARAEVYDGRAFTFVAPVKVAWGTTISELSADGTWTRERTGERVDLKLTGKTVTLEHLRLLAAPLAAAVDATLPANGPGGAGGMRTPAAVRDGAPFWGRWVGNVSVAFNRIKTADLEIDNPHATFNVSHETIRLLEGLGELPNHELAKMEGAVVFDPAAPVPYSLKATADFGEIDAAPLFPAPAPGRDKLFEGRFSVGSTITGSGGNLDDLVSRTQEEFRLESKGGIIRLLKTNVAESLSEPSTPVSDNLRTVGSLVGSLFGIKRETIDSGEIHLSKGTRAVLDFSYRIAEFGYDRIAITAVRGSDGTIRLEDIAISAQDEYLAGSGQIAYAKGMAIAARPLSVELQFGARGALADLLSGTGLLSSQKNPQGYTLFNQPIRFGGSLAHLDDSQWHDLLVKAATPKPDPEKKGGAAAAGKN
jgi:hypothetical protein